MSQENSISNKTMEERHAELKLAYTQGEITQLNVMPKLCVQDAFTKNGVYYPAVYYIPCFTYVDKNGKKFVEDVLDCNEHQELLQAMFEYCYMDLSIQDIQ